MCQSGKGGIGCELVREIWRKWKIMRVGCAVRDRVMERVAETDQDQHKKTPKDTNMSYGSSSVMASLILRNVHS